MNPNSKITHPDICFGISRHNVIIPLKVINIEDYKDGCFRYDFMINHPKPTDYMETHHKADFEHKFTTYDHPLCHQSNRIRLTLEEAKEFITKQLIADKTAALMKINSINKSLSKIDDDIAKLEAAIN